MVMAVVVVVVITLMLVMSVCVAVVVIMIFVVPMAFIVTPAFVIVVIVRMRPVRTGKGRVLVMAGNPTIVWSIGYPATDDPHHLWLGWRRWWRLVANWRRCDPDVNRKLRRRRNSQRCCKQKSENPTVFHTHLRSTWNLTSLRTHRTPQSSVPSCTGIDGKLSQPNAAQVGYAPGLFEGNSMFVSAVRLLNQRGE
jgi:hypothetical protein